MQLYEALMPTIVLSMITGTLPFHIVFKDGVHQLQPTRSAKILGVIYALFFTIFVVDASLNPHNLVIFNYYQSIVSNLGLILELIGGMTLLYIIYVFNLIYGESMCDVFKRCHYVDQVIMQFGSKLHYNHIFYYQIIHIVCGLGTFLTTAIMQYFYSMSIGMGKLSFSLRILILGPLIIIFVMETQYICLAIILRFRFIAVNNELTLLQNSAMDSITISQPKSRKVDVLPKYNDLVRKPIENPVSNPLKHLEVIMNVHDTLCDILDQINYNFGVQMLISIGLNFILGTYSIYYCYWAKVIMYRTTSSIFWFMWASFKIYELIHVAVSCQNASVQIKKTGTHVHKLLLHVDHPRMKEKLCIFSQQLLHRQTKFSALDMFSIDAPLMLSIIATASTYLIIMLQFQESTSGHKHTTIMLNATHSFDINL